MLPVGISLLAMRLWVLSPAAPNEDAAVRAVDCTDLSPQRVEEYLAVEQPEILEPDGPRVLLTCRDESVRIRVSAAGLQTTERAVEPSAENSPEREREVALATSSLLRAAPAKAETARPVEPVAEPPPLRSRDVASVQLGGMARLRDLPRVLPMAGGIVRAGGFLPRSLEVFGQAQLEAGRSRRDRGNVNVLSVAAGPGVAWALRRAQTVGLELWGGVMVGYTRLQGRTARDDVDVGTQAGGFAEFATGVGPRFRFGAVLAVLDLQAGYALPTVRGNVTDEPAVQHGGVWVGAGLRVGAIVRRTVGP